MGRGGSLYGIAMSEIVFVDVLSTAYLRFGHLPTLPIHLHQLYFFYDAYLTFLHAATCVFYGLLLVDFAII